MYPARAGSFSRITLEIPSPEDGKGASQEDQLHYRFNPGTKAPAGFRNLREVERKQSHKDGITPRRLDMPILHAYGQRLSPISSLHCSAALSGRHQRIEDPQQRAEDSMGGEECWCSIHFGTTQWHTDKAHKQPD